MRPVFAVTLLATALLSTRVHASDPPTTERSLDTWFLRVGAGIGGHLGSENATLLESDGYRLGGRDPDDLQRRQLDRVYVELEGTAMSTEGPTSDSRGVRIGPGPGSATIRLPADAQIDPRDPTAFVLIAGRGTALVGSERIDLDRAFRWVSASVEGVTLDAGTEPIVVIGTDDDSSVAELADIQYPLRDDPGFTCSVSVPGR